MDNMYEHISALCKSKGVSVTQMCRDLGITRSALTELKSGRTQRLSIKYTKMILEYFDIDMTVFERPVEEIGLLNENNNEKSPSEVDELLSKPDITELLALYRALTPGEQRKALSVLKALKETE